VLVLASRPARGSRLAAAQRAPSKKQSLLYGDELLFFGADFDCISKALELADEALSVRFTGPLLEVFGTEIFVGHAVLSM
jgi:hypothetical protein